MVTVRVGCWRNRNRADASNDTASVGGLRRSLTFAYVVDPDRCFILAASAVCRTILADPTENTRLSLVFANRHDSDILMKAELDAFAEQYPKEFKVHYVLSKPPADWAGGTGWVGVSDLAILPRPADGTMVLVCGRDEFLETVSGLTARGPAQPGQKKGPKIQGELTGLLATAGYQAKHVYKF